MITIMTRRGEKERRSKEKTKIGKIGLRVLGRFSAY